MNDVSHPELLNTFLALGAISLASLIGSISFAFGKKLKVILPYLLAFASGIIIATAVTHLLPEAMAHLNSLRRVAILFLLGLAGSFLLQYVSEFGHGQGEASHAAGTSLAAAILLSGAAHSFVDGVAIAASFAVGHELGVATTLAVFLHEVPHHIADVGVLIYSGMSRGRATWMNLLATSGCAVGGVLVLLSGLQSVAFTYTVLPVVAANFLYIGVAIAIRVVQGRPSLRRLALQAVSFFAAAGVMMMLRLWEPA